MSSRVVELGNVLPWPKEIQRAILVCDTSLVDVTDLSINELQVRNLEDANLTRRKAMERNKITKIHRDTSSRRLRTAHRLGIGRQTLYNKIKVCAIAA